MLAAGLMVSFALVLCIGVTAVQLNQQCKEKGASRVIPAAPDRLSFDQEPSL
jgi:hypothetical protein